MRCLMQKQTICATRSDMSGAQTGKTPEPVLPKKLHTQAGEVEITVPKLRALPFETAIIESTVEERHP